MEKPGLILSLTLDKSCFFGGSFFLSQTEIVLFQGIGGCAPSKRRRTINITIIYNRQIVVALRGR